MLFSALLPPPADGLDRPTFLSSNVPVQRVAYSTRWSEDRPKPARLQTRDDHGVMLAGRQTGAVRMARQSPSAPTPSRTLAARHLPLLLLLYLVTPVLTLHFVLVPHLLRPSLPTVVPVTQEPLPEEPSPDFSSIASAPERKSLFFDYVEDYVTRHNEELLLLRQRLQADELPPKELLALAERYRVKEGTPAEMREKLLKKVDELPVSL